VAVSADDVRHVAELARLGLDPARIEELVRELNGILAHVDELSAVDLSTHPPPDAEPAEDVPLRADEVAPALLHTSREHFAPATRDGFFLVPRLATHDDAEESA
jgi:aspartyl-tRNA(Asn)/glutamyl-tRNA(Gln) amidotransferase subunit C